MNNINTASPQSSQTTEPPAGRWFNSEGGYFQLPRALRFDERLSHTQRVVLMTIASHVIQCDEVFPSREAIRSYTGMDAADITAHTNALEDFGWLSSRPCKTRNPLFLNDFRVNSDGRISCDSIQWTVIPEGLRTAADGHR